MTLHQIEEVSPGHPSSLVCLLLDKVSGLTLRWAKSRDPNRESLAIKKRAIRIANVLRFEIAIRNARLAIRFKHSDTAKPRKGLRFESAIQNR